MYLYIHCDSSSQVFGTVLLYSDRYSIKVQGPNKWFSSCSLDIVEFTRMCVFPTQKTKIFLSAGVDLKQILNELF